MKHSEVSLCVKYILFSFNIIFWLVGGFILCIGLWARVAYINENNSLDVFGSWDVDPAIIFIFIGIVTFLLGFCGFIGALRENICLLKFFSISLSIICFLQLTAGILGFVYRQKIKGFVIEKLQDTIIRYRSNTNLKEIIDYSQKTFKCCGLRNYKDWRENVYFNCTQQQQQVSEACSVPYSCCKKDILNTFCGYEVSQDSMNSMQREELIYTQGCIDRITKWFIKHLEFIGIVGFSLALLQILGIALATSLVHIIRRQLAKWNSPRGMHQPLHIDDM